MNKENYRILKELNSLNNSILSLQKVISTELSRIDKIQKMRSIRKQELEQFKSKLTEQKKELNLTEDKISYYDNLVKNAQAQLNNLFSENELKSLETQIKNANENLEIIEMKGLELIDNITEIEQKIIDANTFLDGSLKTISDIEKEINENNQETYSQLKINSQRKELLFEQLPTKVSEKFKQLNELKNGTPLTEITDQNSCVTCGYLIPMVILTSVETHSKFHTCPGCNRILIPQSSKFI